MDDARNVCRIAVRLMKDGCRFRINQRLLRADKVKFVDGVARPINFLPNRFLHVSAEDKIQNKTRLPMNLLETESKINFAPLQEALEKIVSSPSEKNSTIGSRFFLPGIVKENTVEIPK